MAGKFYGGEQVQAPGKKACTNTSSLMTGKCYGGEQVQAPGKKACTNTSSLKADLLRLIQPVSFVKDITGYKKSVPLCA